MTVKIVRHPQPRRVICSYCECELEYLKTDVQWDVRQRGQQGTYYYISCPNCQRSVTIDMNQPPSII